MATQVRAVSNRRPLVAVTILVSSLGLVVTGLAMALLHDGEQAFQVRHAWAHAHAVLALVFIVFSVWHVTLNWRCMLNHLGVGCRG